VLHAEGFKPKHQVKTGFDFAEIHEVASSVSELLSLELSVGQTLAVDQYASFLSLDKLPLSMCNMDEFSRKAVISRKGRTRKKMEEAERKQAKEEAKHQNRLERQRIVLQALRRVAHNQPIVIYLCWCDAFTARQLQQELRQTLFFEEGDPWPEDIILVIPSQPIPYDLLESLDSGTIVPSRRYESGLTWQERRQFEESWEKQMRQAFAAKTQAWECYLNSIRGNRSGYGLALIELQKFDEKKNHKDQNIKGAVRRACNRVGLASQMIFPLIPRPKPIPNKGDIMDESRGRMRNAVADLLYRQTGLIYERPGSLYSKAGLPSELTEQLHVVGLYRLSRYNNPRVDYALAICLRPDGTYRALLPQHPERWLPLNEASQMIGELFFNKRAETIDPPREDLARFAAQVFTSMKDVPTLVLFEASDWRVHNLFPQFSNSEAALKNQLDLRQIEPFEHLYSSQDLPYLRIVRLRSIGTVGETPQYVPVLENVENQLTAEKDFEQSKEDEFTIERDFKHLTGIVDIQAEGPFFHYLSIGRMPTTANRQKAKQPQYKLDEGGGIAFKHQTIVEFVPFFLQSGDDAQAWCRVAHFMRFSPSWDGGNIILSYPLHLAKDMLEDQFCILESGLDTEEE
jgi:hypothetical protein